MIGGVIMVLTAIWIYQSLMKAKKSHVILWVAACSVLFFITEFATELFCIEIIDALGGKDIGGTYDPSLAEVHDRKTQEGAGGLIMPFLCELLPSAAGVVAVAVVRSLVILKQGLNPATLFEGIKEMFLSIRDSFKTTSN
jgi:hypothetical protein